MRKKFKGFTLIECIVALGVLGIASLTMAQIYASVAQRNRMNHLVNTSLSNQMAYVEKYTNTEAVQIQYGAASTTPAPTPPHKTSASQNDNFIKVTNTKSSDEYSFPVDIYVLKSRDSKDQTLDKTRTQVNSGDVGNTAGYGEDNYNLRYKYLLGHTGS